MVRQRQQLRAWLLHDGGCEGNFCFIIAMLPGNMYTCPASAVWVALQPLFCQISHESSCICQGISAHTLMKRDRSQTNCKCMRFDRPLEPEKWIHAIDVCLSLSASLLPTSCLLRSCFACLFKCPSILKINFLKRRHVLINPKDSFHVPSVDRDYQCQCCMFVCCCCRAQEKCRPMP